MPHGLPCDGQLPALTNDKAYHILDMLGLTPVEVLTTKVDYGMNDDEISRYFRFLLNLVTIRRQRWQIAGDSTRPNEKNRNMWLRSRVYHVNRTGP